MTEKVRSEFSIQYGINIERKIPQVLQELEQSPIYISRQVVRERFSEHNEGHLININGTWEKIFAEWGDRIIEFDNGLVAHITGRDFDRRLKIVGGNGGRLEADLLVKAKSNSEIFNEYVSLIAPSHEMVFGGPDSILAAVYNLESSKLAVRPFIMSKEEFARFNLYVPANVSNAFAA